VKTKKIKRKMEIPSVTVNRFSPPYVDGVETAPEAAVAPRRAENNEGTAADGEAKPSAAVSRQCLHNLLNSIHGSHAYFTPTPRFYAASGINSHRWAKLYRGELSITIDELKQLCKALNVTFSAETFLRQLKLFDLGNEL
jgi:hypothetical protein